MFLLRKESVHKCVYTNVDGHYSVYTIWATNKSSLWVNIRRESNIGNDVVRVITDHLNKRMRLSTNN